MLFKTYYRADQKNRKQTKGTRPAGNDGNVQPFNVSEQVHWYKISSMKPCKQPLETAT